MDDGCQRRDLTVEGYTLVREVGSGAMGVVFESGHTQLGKRVALKLLHPTLRNNAVATERFVREGRVAARLRHPHIIEVLDAGASEAGPFLVMEYVDGPTLAEHLRNSGPLSVGSAVELGLPIVSALMHAHSEGVVHRDVKPANILLARDRFGDVCPKIGDFGLGKWLDPEADQGLTRDGVVGSLPYMAPEQLRDARTVDARADQYSLAVVLYEAVAGRLPFEPNGGFALMEAIGWGRTLPLAEQGGTVAAAFAEVIHRAMSLRVADRYPSLAELGRALLRFSSGRSWAMWAREFGAPAGGLNATFDDAISLATEPLILSPSGSAGGRGWRQALASIMSFVLGAVVASTASQAMHPRVKQNPSTESSERPVAPDDRPIAKLDVPPSVPTSAVSPAPTSHAEAQPARPLSPPNPPATYRPGDAVGRRAPALIATPAASNEWGPNHAPILE